MMTDKMVPLIQAEDVLEVKLHDLLLSSVEIHTKQIHGQTYVDPNEMMKAKHQIENRKKEEHGK